MILRPAAIRPFEVYGPVFACARGFCLCKSGEFKHTFPGASIVHQWNFAANSRFFPLFQEGKVDKATVSRHLDGGVCLHDDPPV